MENMNTNKMDEMSLVKEFADNFKFENGSVEGVVSGDFSKISDAIRSPLQLKLTDGKIGDALDNEIDRWCPHRSVFISAPTGSGKTSFVLDKILKRCKQSKIQLKNGYWADARLLIVSNRSALNRQLKIRLANKYDEKLSQKFKAFLDADHPEFIDDEKEIDCVTITSYQNLFKTIDRMAAKRELDKFAYVVFDESHYFLEDSTFNAYSQGCLEKIAWNFNDQIRIYLSATMEDVLPDIYSIEKKVIANKYQNVSLNMLQGNYCSTRVHSCFSMNCYEKNVLAPQMELLNENYVRDSIKHGDLYSCLYRAVLYEFPVDYSIYQPYFFQVKSINDDEDSKMDFENLYKFIKESTGKWFIYVKRTKDGETLESAINGIETDKETNKETNKGLGKKAVFISRSRINEKQKEPKRCYDSIVKDAKYPKDVDVVITTKIMDNGINIEDSNVTNVVIMSYDRTEFLQALGRVRKTGQKKINLFIAEYNKQDLSRIRRRIGQSLRVTEEHDDLFQFVGSTYDKLPEHMYVETVCLNGGMLLQPRVNNLAIKKYRMEHALLSDLLEYQEETCVVTEGQLQHKYREMVWSWLGHTETYEEAVAKEETRLDALKADLNALFDEQERIDKYNSKDFTNKLREIFAKHDYPVVGKTEGREGGSTILKNKCKDLIERTYSTLQDGTVKIKYVQI